MTASLLPLVSHAAEPVAATGDIPARREQAEAIAGLLATVPAQQRIVVPAIGATLAHLVIFVDTDCPYCRQLHELADAITRRGIEIDYLFYPRSGPTADSYGQAIAVWCAADRLAALEKVYTGEELAAATCDNPVMAHYELALELGLKGTPAIVTPDGVIAYGVPNRDRLASADRH